MVTLGNEFGCADQIGRAAFQDAGANGHVTAHDLELVRRQLAGLAQDGIGDTDLADIMQGRRQIDGSAACRAQADARSDELADLGHAGDMLAGIAVAIFDGPSQTPDDLFLARQKVRRGQLDLACQPVGPVRQCHLRSTQRQQIGHAGLQFGRIKRLVDEVRGPGADRLYTDIAIHIGGDHDDGHQAVGLKGAKGAGELYAVHFRHDVIDQHKIVLCVATPLERLGRMQAGVDIGGGGAPDDRADHGKTGPAIIDNQHTHIRPRNWRQNRRRPLYDS